MPLNKTPTFTTVSIYPPSFVVEKALLAIGKFIATKYSEDEIKVLQVEIGELAGAYFPFPEGKTDSSKCICDTFQKLQDFLSRLNEKEQERKKKGVYYTPHDVVHFIVLNTIKISEGVLSPENIATEKFNCNLTCCEKTFFDPTCGAGEFLLESLSIKLEEMIARQGSVSRRNAKKIMSTIYGNDINVDSIIITKLRLFLMLLEKTGCETCKGIAEILNQNFTCRDFVTFPVSVNVRFDIIVGNPPYVEDNKSGLNPEVRFGNIYANVLSQAEKMLASDGGFGFVVPLSYISTPRMSKLRKYLLENIKVQYILSYADRPDCLFDSVHQKLCIIVGKKCAGEKKVYTSRYQYWYSSERDSLFRSTSVVMNPFVLDSGIPKLGSEIEKTIFKKITDSSSFIPIYPNSRCGNEAVYLNRRETFWMKAYRSKVDDPEYKVFFFKTPEHADYCYCIINSSLFWWYWICVSDCWHVSKDLNGFLMPPLEKSRNASSLAGKLQTALERTKHYIGTKQTEYEYKHRECLGEISAIDDYVNGIYGLTQEESNYIKSFSLRYRTSGGSI